MFSDLPKNAKLVIALEPMSAIIAGMILYFAPLYMKGIGLNSVEIGIVNTTGLFAGCICQFFAAPVTNRLGRKRTTTYLSVVAWSVPLLIWAAAKNFNYFMAAAVIFAATKIVGVAWSCLITEDVDENKKAKVFGTLCLISSISGIFTFAAGFFMEKFNLVPTMRVLYAFGFVIMTVMFLIRHFFLEETKTGLDLMKKHSRISLKQSVLSFFSTASKMLKDRKLTAISCIYILFNFIVSMNFVQVIYIKEQLGFTIGSISSLPAIGAVLNTFLFIFLIPRFKDSDENKLLAVSLIVYMTGFVMFLFLPSGNMPLLITVMSIIGIGNFLTGTYCNSILFNIMKESEKADVFSVVQTVTLFVCIPSAYISGYLYNISTIIPFIAISMLFSAAITVAFLALQKRKNTGGKDASQQLAI